MILAFNIISYGFSFSFSKFSYFYLNRLSDSCA